MPSLADCAACGTHYAPELEACPNCGEADTWVVEMVEPAPDDADGVEGGGEVSAGDGEPDGSGEAAPVTDDD